MARGRQRIAATATVEVEAGAAGSTIDSVNGAGAVAARRHVTGGAAAAVIAAIVVDAGISISCSHPAIRSASSSAVACATPSLSEADVFYLMRLVWAVLPLLIPLCCVLLWPVG